MSAPAAPAPPRIGPYAVGGLLAEGGMAAVYRAAAPDGTPVALKVSRYAETDTRYGSALRNEADLLSRLDHPNVVRVLPIPVEARLPVYAARAARLPGSPWYYAMPFLAGGVLSEIVGGRRVLPLDVAAAVGYQIGRGLLHLHALGYAHLDVKPENILFRTPLGRGALVHPVLVDFGVAVQGTDRLDGVGGTLLTMAPERIDPPPGGAPVDASRLDSYALGVTLYRIVTGQYPFIGTTRAALISSIQHSRIIPAAELRAGVPPLLSAVITGCLARQPGQRLTLADAVMALQAVPNRITRMTTGL